MRRIASFLFLLVFLTAPELSAQRVNSIGVELPEDAAPPERQRLRFFEMDGTYMEWFKTIYRRSPATNLISEPLVRQDHNYDLVPAAAKSWEATPDGNTWLFHLRSGMQWDDGRPFNAHDYVFTFRRGRIRPMPTTSNGTTASSRTGATWSAGSCPSTRWAWKR